MMRGKFLLIVLTVSLPQPALAQGRVPGGTTLLDWLGLEPGEHLTYMGDSSEPMCVEVGGPITLDGRRYAPLMGISWPGLASDGQVFLPLDGTLGIGVIRGPVLDPAEGFDWLLPPLTTRFVQRSQLAHPGALPGDGWYAIGEEPSDPFALLYVWCQTCSDAGTYVWMEKGRGITRIEERTIAGPQRLELVAEGCESDDLEVEVYVAPPPERRP
jgi:hypothetical protein